MQDLPIVRLIDHPADAGYLREWRRSADGWEARVSWINVQMGYTGGLEEEQGWLPASRVEPLPSEDYSRVPRTRT